MSALRQLKILCLYLKEHLFITFLIVFGSIVALLFIVPNGDTRCVQGVCGLYIGKWHTHDVMWHIALAEIAFKTYPFQNPIYSGAALNGYNYLLDITVYFLSQLGLSPFFIFLKLLPFSYVILFAFTALYYLLKQSKSALYVACFIFFFYYGSSMNYLLTLYHHGSIGLGVLQGFPVVLAIQSGFVLTNQQFAFSLVIILWMLTYLKKEISLKQSIMLSVLLFLCTGLKFYGGILMCFVLGVYEIIWVMKTKHIKLFLLKTGCYILGFTLSLLLFYNPFHQSSIPGPIFAFSPLAMIHSLIEEKDLFFSANLTLARYTLYAHGISPRLAAIELYSLLLFIVMNFGSRLIGLIYVAKQLFKRKLQRDEVVLFLTVIISTLIPVLFVQKGVWFNTMQFLYYGVFFMNIFAAKFLYELFASKKTLSVIAAVLIIIVTLPGTIEQFRYAYLPQEVIAQKELDALNYLKKQPDGTVFALPATYGIAYVAALSAHPTYFASSQILDNTGVDYKARLDQLYSPKSINVSTLPVKYFYLLKSDHEFSLYKGKIMKTKLFKKIFENEAVEIYSRII